MLKSSIVSHVQEAVRTAILPLSALNVAVEEGHDYEGQDVLDITIDLPAGTDPIPGPIYMRLLSSLNRLLLRSGEERVPLIRTVREGEEERVENDVARHL